MTVNVTAMSQEVVGDTCASVDAGNIANCFCTCRFKCLGFFETCMSNLSIAAIESGQIYLTKKFMRGGHGVSQRCRRQKKQKRAERPLPLNLKGNLASAVKSICKDGEGIVDCNGFTQFKCKCKDSRTFSSAKEFKAHENLKQHKCAFGKVDENGDYVK